MEPLASSASNNPGGSNGEATTQTFSHSPHNKQGSDEAQKAKKFNVEESMTQYKILETIRTGDIVALDNLISAPDFKSHWAFGTPLHLACGFGSKQLVEHLLTSFQFDCNARSESTGQTCLMVASKAGRLSIVEMLMRLPDIDCTLVDLEGKDCRDLAKTSEVVNAIDSYRRAFAADKSKMLLSLASSGEWTEVQNRSMQPRIQRLSDVNEPDPVSGNTLLHYASEQNNLEMVTWCLKRKADPFLRDKRGRLPIEKATNDKVKSLLKGVLAQTTFTPVPLGNASPSASSAAVKMQGILYKWTNYAGGYKKRWFVLENGVLSYYRSQEDVPVSCRGSISMRIAKLWIDASDRNRFDIIGKGNMRYHLRAEHPTEAKRWVIALTEAKQWLQDNSVGSSAAAPHPIANGRASGGGLNTTLTTLDRRSTVTSVVSSVPESEVSFPPSAATDKHKRLSSKTLSEQSFSELMPTEEEEEDDDDDDFNDPNHADETFEELIVATINSGLACVHYQQDLMSSFNRLLDHSHAAKQPQLMDTYKQSSKTLEKTLRDLQVIVENREAVWKKRLEKEMNLKRIWEENLSSLAAEHDELRMKASQQVDMLESKAAANTPVAEHDSDEDGGADEFFDAVDLYQADSSSKAKLLVLVDDTDTAATGDVNPRVADFIGSEAQGYEKLNRTELPLIYSTAKMEISLWSILKNNIGKDLSKIPLPVFFNEPTSLLQRFCEDFEYYTLLDIANSRENSLERIQFVAAFAMSNYASTIGRCSKPFNPLLGETYEYVSVDGRFRYLAEQVSHHPPISVCHCESENYIFWAEGSFKQKFWGKSLELAPLGRCHLILKRTGEHFSWKKVTTCVNNLIVGKLWMDHYGDLAITNYSTGEKCTLTFKPAGWRGKSQHEIVGYVSDDSGKRDDIQISGHWNDRLVSRMSSADGCSPANTVDANTAPGATTLGRNNILWKRHPLPPKSEKMFNFTEFTIRLNEMNPEIQNCLCPTDSRLRPDQRAMEDGHYDLADKEKGRLEEHQRAKRHDRNRRGIEWQPIWFYKTIEKDTAAEHWVYKGGYWEARAKGEWPAEVPRDLYTGTLVSNGSQHSLD